jgi:serine/threonine protein kinase/tetratricopeptide (TPR) repeat protein
MKGFSISEAPPRSGRIAGRYQIERTLGQGGMAIVYLVHDITNQKKLALKRLSIQNQDPDKHNHLAELFEHEYYTLTQLSHPHVVEVYDFGRDGSAPYYTMELLDGGDLRDLSPLDWKKACVLMYDVCSVLSLLHSRHLIHRDLTPRNVHCTRDMKVKLIDFGAMQPMGPCKQVVGTPTYTAPEVMTLQSLDARTDLYSLGTTLYYVLTGRNAYPARNFNALRYAWRTKRRSPSSLVPEIPKELDALVLSMIELDPIARPSNAAEVMDRLSAIASLEVSEHLTVSQSYLSTPLLVGRDAQVLRIRKQLIKARRGSGRSVVVESEPGMGRSRFLDACVLEGKLLGATVLRADASDAHSGAWGVVRVLATQLLDAVPREASKAAKPYLSVLGHIMPDLINRAVSSMSLQPRASIPPVGKITDHTLTQQTEGGEQLSSSDLRIKRNSWRPSSRVTKSEIPLEEFEDPQQLRPRVQIALRDWLLTISVQRSIIIAVDDFHRIDEPSAAFLALLSNEVSTKNILVVATTEIDVPESAATTLKLLRQNGSSVKLKGLKLEHTQALLGSVFGDAPNVQLLADRLYRVSQGSPSAVMKFAQHLVDKGVIRYEAGAWTLPNRIDTGDLPESLNATLKTRLEKLKKEALELAETLVLSPEQSFSVDECLCLSDLSDKARVIQTLNELLSFEIVSTDGHRYALSQQGWVSVLKEGVDKERSRALHLRLAEMYIRRGNEACRIARHLFEAGEEERGLDVLISDAESDKKKIDQSSKAFSDFVLSLPRDWREVYEKALSISLKQNRPKKQSFLLRVILTRISDHSGLEKRSHVIEVVDQLVRDSGLACYKELGDSLDEQSRVWRALELTQKRYDESPQSERVLPVQEAIPELAKTLSNVVGIAASSYDTPLLAAMPSLGPLAPLSPALHVIDQIVAATLTMFSAHLEKSIERFREVIKRISEPDRGGLDDTVYKNTYFGFRYGLGMVESSLGIKSSLEWAEEIEKEPLHQVNAWRIRMVYYLRQGDVYKAEACKKKIEVLQIQNSPSQFYEGSHLYPELNTGAWSDDLVKVKRVIDGLEPMAKRFAPWIPVLHFARGEYQRIRGDFKSALKEHKKALSLMAPTRHITWASAMGAYLKTLLELDRTNDVIEIAEKKLVEAENAGLQVETSNIRLPLAIAYAKQGKFESALKQSETSINSYRALGSTGMNIGGAYENRARVAVLMGDEESFRTYANLCAEQYKAGRNPALTAKYEKLMQFAARADLGVTDALAHAADATSQLSGFEVKTVSADLLSDCQGAEARAQRVIDLLVQQSNSSGGYLYTLQEEGAKLVAQNGTNEPPNRMDTMVGEYLAAEANEYKEVTMTCADLKSATTSRFDWTFIQGSEYHPVLLGHNADNQFVITGLAVLFTNANKVFRFPTESVIAMSKSLHDAGDVSAIFAAD